MRPQISLKLISSFSFSCQASHNRGKEAGWRGFCSTHLLLREVRGGRGPGLLSIDYYISFPQHNVLTAPHAFHHQDVVPPLAAGDSGGSTPSEEGNHLSQHERKELTGVRVTPPRILITSTTLLEIIFLNGVIKALRPEDGTGPRTFLLSVWIRTTCSIQSKQVICFMSLFLGKDGILAAATVPQFAEIKQTAVCVWTPLKHPRLAKQTRLTWADSLRGVSSAC